MSRVHGIHDNADGVGGPSGCGWYRIVLPFSELRNQGWDATWKHGIPPDPAGTPIIVAQRTDNVQALPEWRRWKRHSKLVYELDDDIWNVPWINQLAWKTYHKADVQDVVQTAAMVADAVTVTTEPLAEILRKFNPNVHVLPNYIPGAICDWDRPEPRWWGKKRRVVIGWQGGVSHSLDMQVVAGPVRHILDQHRHASLHIVGSDYRATFGRTGVFTDWVPVGPNLDYYRTLLPFDIGLAPLSGDVFDVSKSHIKALEYAAMGIPVLASDMEPYRDFVVDGVTGYLIRRKQDWAKRLAELVNDHEARDEMGRAARRLARGWTIETGWKSWANLYDSLESA